MTKEKEMEKILIATDRTITHVMLDFAYALKKNREALDYEFEEIKEKESKRIAIEGVKADNERLYERACTGLKSIRVFARMMIDALNIEDTYDLKYNEIRNKETEAIEKLLSLNFDEETELEKLII